MKPSLKIHDPTTDIERDVAPRATVFDDLCAAFAKATGWSLRLRQDPADTSSPDLTGSNSNTSSTGVAPGTVSLELSPGSMAGGTMIGVRTPRKLAEPLARAIARMLGEVAETRHALWQREAELAAGVPVAARPAQPEVLAERLDGILRGGCEALGCTAAALYLLDAGTTELKLRAAWGLARFKLAEPPRPLRGATADLEALTGHAVVLANAELCALWHAPEPAEAALCIPVASSSMPLGTLWFFASAERDFDDGQTQLAEIIAGRLVADLEREVLLGDAASRAADDRRERSLKRWTFDQASLPRIELPGWSLASCNDLENVDEHVGAATFVDCFMTDHDTLAVVLGAAHLDGPEGQMAATAVRTAVRAHAAKLRRASAVVDATHRTVSATFAGNLTTSLAVALVHPKSGWFHFAAAGELAAVVRRAKRVRTLRTGANPIGGDEPPATIEERGRIAAGEQLIFARLARKSGSDDTADNLDAALTRFSKLVRAATGTTAANVVNSIVEGGGEHASAPGTRTPMLAVGRGDTASGA